ncbi:MAG: hypothetical protein JXB62_01180 [Pirellulales bacterium]|nr:hypothetical protein [Pirellulales bacterium]
MKETIRSARPAAWSALAAWMLLGGAAWAGTCLSCGEDCRGGRCIPNTKNFGYFPTQWRAWPGEPRPGIAFPQSIGAEVLPTPQGQPHAPSAAPGLLPGAAAPMQPPLAEPPLTEPPLTEPPLTEPPLIDPLPGGGALPPENGFDIEPLLPGMPEDLPATPPLLPDQSPTGPTGPTGPPALEPPPVVLPPTLPDDGAQLQEPAAVPPVVQQGPVEPEVVDPPQAGPPLVASLPDRPQKPAAPTQPQATPPASEPLPTPDQSEPAGASATPPDRVTPRGDVPAALHEAGTVELPKVGPPPAAGEPATLPTSHSADASASQQPPQQPAPATLQANWMAALHPGFRGDASRLISTHPVTSPAMPVVHQATIQSPSPTAEQPPAEASAAPSARSPVVGLDGFCPVELVEREHWQPGKPGLSAVHQGRTYLLAGPAQRQRFLADPDRYTPRYAGCDPVLVVDANRRAAGSTDFCVTYEGQLYMFSSTATLAQFGKDPQRYLARKSAARVAGKPGH